MQCMSAETTYKYMGEFIRQFTGSGISVLKVLAKSNFSVKLPEAKSNTCIILGNGPSLKTSIEKHPEFIAAHSLMCVNNFAVTDEYEKLKPGYYAMLDPVYWVKNPNQMVADCLENLRKKTTWKLQLLVPVHAKRSKAFRLLAQQNEHIEITYFNYTVFKGFENASHSFYKRNLAMPQSQNILVACLFLGINIGFKELYLLGADHTWHEQLHVNEKNEVCLKDFHFYEDEKQTNYRIFYKDLTQTDSFKMHELFHTFGKMFYGYHVIQKYAETRNCKIYNASEVSFIDAFERKKL